LRRSTTEEEANTTEEVRALTGSATDTYRNYGNNFILVKN
jgi:hypothetical protein